MARNNKPNTQDQEPEVVESNETEQTTEETVVQTTPEGVSELAQAIINADPKEQSKPVEPTPTPNPQEPVVTPTPVEATTSTAKSTVLTPVGPAAGIAEELAQYKEAMIPGKYVPAVTGAENQRKLFRLIERTINRVPDESFKDCMNTLLEWFHENENGVAGEAYVFRFPGEWRGTPDEYYAYIRLITLFRQLANPSTRAAVVATTGFEYYLQYGTTEAGRERLLAFFGK